MEFNLDLTNKVVVITGAGGIICGGIAKALAPSKAKIAILDLNLEAAEKVAKEVQEIVANYFKNQPVLKAWLFGSYARGEQTPLSDVDILVQYDENALITLLTISRIMTRLSDAVGKKVDLVEDGCLLPFAQQSAERDKILIYERAS